VSVFAAMLQSKGTAVADLRIAIATAPMRLFDLCRLVKFSQDDFYNVYACLRLLKVRLCMAWTDIATLLKTLLPAEARGP
jgi:hypothetical protein